MQLLKRVKWVYVLLSVFLMALGASLFVWPNIPSVTICCAIGGGAVVLGIFKIVLYFLRDIQAVGEQNDFAIGAMCVIAGAILLIHPAAILSMIPQVLGVYMLIDCVFKLQIALDAKRLGSGGWWLSLLVTLVCIIWGLMLVWQPFGLEKHLMTLIAGGLIADGGDLHGGDGAENRSGGRRDYRTRGVSARAGAHLRDPGAGRKNPGAPGGAEEKIQFVQQKRSPRAPAGPRPHRAGGGRRRGGGDQF